MSAVILATSRVASVAHAADRCHDRPKAISNSVLLAPACDQIAANLSRRHHKIAAMLVNNATAGPPAPVVQCVAQLRFACLQRIEHATRKLSSASDLSLSLSSRTSGRSSSSNEQLITSRLSSTTLRMPWRCPRLSPARMF
jgi:hypothetical protein